jgi:hypothetical protein
MSTVGSIYLVGIVFAIYSSVFNFSLLFHDDRSPSLLSHASLTTRSSLSAIWKKAYLVNIVSGEGFTGLGVYWLPLLVICSINCVHIR